MAQHRYLAEKGIQILRNGYNVVPIMPGQKFPVRKDFLTHVTTTKDIEKWKTNGHARDGIGITTATTPTVDIDTLDRDCARHMHQWVYENIGVGLTKIGQPPKRAILFRSINTFRKLSSPVFYSSGDVKNQIEILGDGQQTVCFHVHPDTRKPYFWLGLHTPETLHHDELHVLTVEDAQRIIDEFIRYCRERGWREATRTGTALTQRSRNNDDDLAEWGLDTDPVGLSDEEIREYLFALANDERFDLREDWTKIGMAVWHETRGSDFGYEAFLEWSQQHPSHDQARFDKFWRSLGKYDDRRDPITFRWLIKLAPQVTAKRNEEKADEIVACMEAATTRADLIEIAAECQKIMFVPLNFAAIVNALQVAFKRITTRGLPIGEARKMVRYTPDESSKPEWLEGWCYLQHSEQFFNTETKQTLSHIAFDATFGRCIPPDSPYTVTNFALDIVKIPVFDKALYLPPEDETFKFNGRLCVNTYSTVNIPDIPDPLSKADRAAIETVRRHFLHLFPGERDTAIFLSWCAYIVQTKKRPNWAIVLQGVEGDGKSFFGAMMAAVLGGDNVRMMNAQTLEGNFTDWAQGQLLTFIEELRLRGHNRHDVLNRVKPLITNDTIEIHPKRVNPFTAPNTTAYLASTNFIDALPLDNNDRRYFILLSQWQDAEKLQAFLDQNPAYFDNLYGAIENRPGAIRHWLENYELHPEFKPRGRAPFSQGRQEMVAINKSEIVSEIEDIIAEGKHDDVCADLLIVSSLNALLADDGGELVSGQTLKTALTTLGFRRIDRIKINGKPENVWTKNREKWPTDKIGINEAVRKYLENTI